MLFLQICVTFSFVVLQCFSENLSFEFHNNVVKRSIKSEESAKRYHSNHPPLEEYVSVSIPVAIVYDENQKTAKALTTEKTITTYHPSFETTKAPTEEINLTTTVSTNNISEPNKPQTKSTNELQIPVVVVYDPVTDKNIKRNVVTEKPEIEKNNKQARRTNRQRGRTLKPTEKSETLTTTADTTTVYPIEHDSTTLSRDSSTTKRQYIPSRTRRTTVKPNYEQSTKEISLDKLQHTTTPLPTTTSTTLKQGELKKSADHEARGTQAIGQDNVSTEPTVVVLRRQTIASRTRAITTEQNTISTTPEITKTTLTSEATTAATVSRIEELTTRRTKTPVKVTETATELTSSTTIKQDRQTIASRTRATTTEQNTINTTPEISKAILTSEATAAATVSRIEELTTRRTKTPVKVTETATELTSSTTIKPKRKRDPVVPILESQNYVYAQSGVFHYSYEGGDGTKNFENGKLKSFDDEATGEAVSGGFSYKDKDGTDYSLTYTADENGYRPVGAHLPTPPPIPPAIARALAHLATKTPPPEDVTESL